MRNLEIDEEYCTNVQHQLERKKRKNIKVLPGDRFQLRNRRTAAAYQVWNFLYVPQ